MRGPNRAKVKTERRLRRNSTDAEMVLWLSLRDRRLCGFKFVRQEAIESFVVDFVCREKNLIIEVDGGQHTEDEQAAHDAVRDRVLEGQGFRVMRFWASSVHREIDDVMDAIVLALEARALAPPRSRGESPSPRGGGKL